MRHSGKNKTSPDPSTVPHRETENEGERKRPSPATWKDPETGLEWQCEGPGEMNWYEALEYARSLSLDGKDDWRLPAALDLDTLLDRRTLFEKMRPDVRQEVPFRDTLSYWSSTTFEDNTKNAWIMMFDGAYVLSYYKSNSYFVRCVRGSMKAGGHGRQKGLFEDP